jgi:hypothetical protein
LGIDYTVLRDLLAVGAWQAAHDETQRVMLVAASKVQPSKSVPPRLWVEHVLVFPCADLLTIDGLWTWASGGRFGLSVQLDIYQGLGGSARFDFGIWWAFCYEVGWIVKEPIYDFAAPRGHMPWITRSSVMALDSDDAMVLSLDQREEADHRYLYGIFFDRVARCVEPGARQRPTRD